MLISIALAAFLSTLIGGLVALRLRDKLHLILGFSAGAVIAVAFFDLMPEALSLGQDYFDASFMLSIVAAGFLAYLILDRVIFLHSHAEEEGHESHAVAGHTAHGHTHDKRTASKRGILGAGSLSIHSFLDGVAIGLAFQVSVSVGLVVAIAVLVHDFSDGINTVSMILKGDGSQMRAFRWLIVDATAPVLGAASTLLFSLSQEWLAIVLAIFSGFFLYIGASDLIPESQHRHPKFLTTAMTLIGAGVLYLAIHFASI